MNWGEQVSVFWDFLKSGALPIQGILAILAIISFILIGLRWIFSFRRAKSQPPSNMALESAVPTDPIAPTGPTKGSTPLSSIGTADTALPLPNKPSVAVLAFQNMSGDPEQEYFSDGISEDIITDLSKLSGLFVIARNSSFAYKGKPVDLRQVGRELGVRYVLEGSVRKSGDRVRISAQLIEAETGNHFWAERYDRKLEDMFALQDEITEEVVTSLDVKLVSGEQARVWRKSLKNPAARDNFYRAENFLNQRMSKEEFVEAGKLYEKVTLLEPESPLGFVGLARTHWFEAWRGWSESLPQSLERAAEAAQKALVLDEFNGEAHAFLGLVFVLNRRYEEAVAEGERAVALSPNSADVALFAGFILVLSCEPREAVAVIQQAIRLSPVPAAFAYNILGVSYRDLGQYEEAIAALKKGIAIEPELTTIRFALVTVYCALERFEEAQAEAQEIQKIDPRFSLEDYAKRLPFKDAAIAENILANFGKAGLV